MKNTRWACVATAVFLAGCLNGGGNTILPVAPSDLQATAKSKDAVELTWKDNSSDEAAFLVERAKGDGAMTQIASVPANTTSFKDTGLTAGTTYSYRVRAQRSAEFSDYSNTASATTDGTINGPAAPSDLKAVVESGPAVTLTWKNNGNDVDGIVIERGLVADQTTPVFTAATNETTWKDTGVQAGKTYFYRARAKKGALFSEYSNTTQAQIPQPPTPPAAPTELKATAAGDSKIDLTWKDNSSDEDGFEIERGASANSMALIGTVGANTTAYSDTGLTPSTTYQYRVRAKKGGLYSSYSNTDIATTLTPVVLPGPYSIYTWGRNFEGQLGDTTTNSHTAPTVLAGLTNVSAISGGELHTIALLSDGTVKVWGSNSGGQLGVDSATTPKSTTPLAVNGLTGVKAVAAGREFSVVLLNDGTVRTWGRNDGGQLGNGTTASSFTLVTPTGLANVKAIAVGTDHTVALLNDGTVKVWGKNDLKQIDIGSSNDVLTPKQLDGLSSIKAVAVGNGHSAALKEDGTVLTWGINTDGQLGTGKPLGLTAYAPTVVGGLPPAKAVSCGFLHTVVLLNDGTVQTWGDAKFGQLGEGTMQTGNKAIPATVPGLSGVKSISAGYYHTLVLLDDGTVKSWGLDTFGQLGFEALNWGMKATPTVVPGLSDVKAVAGGGAHSFALKSPN